MVSSRARVRKHSHTHTYTHTHTSTHALSHAHTHTHIRTHKHTHITRTHTHTHLYRHSWPHTPPPPFPTDPPHTYAAPRIQAQWTSALRTKIHTNAEVRYTDTQIHITCTSHTHTFLATQSRHMYALRYPGTMGIVSTNIRAHKHTSHRQPYIHTGNVYISHRHISRNTKPP